MDFCREFISTEGEIQAGALDTESTGSVDPEEVPWEIRLQLCAWGLFGLFSSFRKVVLFQKEPFYHRTVKEARVRKGVFLLRQCFLKQVMTLLCRNFAAAILRAGTVSESLRMREQGVLNRS